MYQNSRHILKMDNYTKGKIVEEPLERDKIPLPSLPDNFLWMQVHGGSKMRNLLSHALGVVTDGGAKSVVWTGSGPGLSKAISCAEIMKRELKIDHQISTICYRKTEEFWEPKLDGLEQIIVNREVPTIHILLSQDELSTSHLGYQSNKKETFWEVKQPRELSSGKKNKIPRTRKPRMKKNKNATLS